MSADAASRRTGTLGDLIDSLGIAHSLGPGELVCNAIVLLETIDAEGRVGLCLAYNDSMSWIKCVGLLRTAEHLELANLNGEAGA